MEPGSNHGQFEDSDMAAPEANNRVRADCCRHPRRQLDRCMNRYRYTAGHSSPPPGNPAHRNHDCRTRLREREISTTDFLDRPRKAFRDLGSWCVAHLLTGIDVDRIEYTMMAPERLQYSHGSLWSEERVVMGIERGVVRYRVDDPIRYSRRDASWVMTSRGLALAVEHALERGCVGLRSAS